jgi:ABC-type nitrate/sulfonate/bicarbonate transport system substrate-binding protein
VLVAADRGIFSDQGLDVLLTRVRRSSEMIEGLVDGRFDVIHATADDVIGWRDETGAPVTAWMGGTTGPLNLATRPEVGGPADLRGRAIGVDDLTRGFVSVLRRLLRDHGIAEDEVQLVPVGATPLRVEALREGRIAATLLPLPWSSLAADTGMTVWDPQGGEAQPACGASLEPWLDANAETVDAYLRAVVAALTWLYTEPDPAPSEAIASALGIGGTVAAAVKLRLLEPRAGWPPTAYLDPTALAAAHAMRAEVGRTPLHDPAAYLTHEPYRRVLGFGSLR